MCHMSISYVYTSITMANLKNSIPQLPHTLHISGTAVINHDNYDRPISRVVIGREVDHRSRLIYVRYCLTSTTLCL